MATIPDKTSIRLQSENRLHLALNALDAVRDLCIEAASAHGNTLGHLDADNFACLLGLIVDEMRDAQEDL